MYCTDALSTSSDADEAAATVASALAAASSVSPDIVFVFATSEHASALTNLRDRIRSATGARHIVGCTAAGAIGGGHEYEHGPCLAAFSVRCESAVIEPFHATLEPTGEDSAEIRGVPFDRLVESPNDTTLLFADPFSFPVDALFKSAREQQITSPWIGGLASGGSRPGSNILLCDDLVTAEGAIGVRVGGALRVEPIVSQGCRPIGRHFVITKGHENVIDELGGASALSRLEEQFQSLSEADRTRFARAIHIGRVVDEYKSEFRRGDFLVRSVVGIDKKRGCIAINDFVRRGSTVQFMLRDPRSASEELDELLATAVAGDATSRVRGALLFACNGRGSRMFNEPDHDVTRVRSIAKELPVSGFFAAGEIGPIGNSTFVHGFTASIALFSERRA